MARDTRPLVVALLALLGACGPKHAPAPAGGASPVALLTQGSAFARAGLQDVAAGALDQATGRPVVRLDPTSAAASRQRVAARLARTHRAAAAYDWREPGCKADGASAAIALDYDVGGVYRLTLEHDEQSGDAGTGLGRLLGAVKRAPRPATTPDTLTGSVIVWTPGAGEQRVPVAHTVTGERLDLEAIVASTMRKLSPPGEPRWEGLASRLLGAGCPLLALAVADAKLAPGSPRRRVETSALAAIRRTISHQTARQRARDARTGFDAALHRGDLGTAASFLARYEADSAHDPATAERLTQALAAARAQTAPAGDRPRDERYSCDDLCGMHMVEMCNNDRTLWTGHRAQWEPTPCGTRRAEPFLADCYTQQWLTGTFQDSCVAPCEQSSDGRAHLVTILQRAGCLRPAS